MRLTAGTTDLIERVINAFETGRAQAKYEAIAVLNDGPHGMRQLSYGRAQVTEYGNLRALIARYVACGGSFAPAFAGYVDKIGATPLSANRRFRSLLRRAALADPLMGEVQDEFFRREYLEPSSQWAARHGFVEPLSALVIYDSWVHSGGMLWVIRSRFAERPPSSGGDEKTWIAEYVRARAAFLASHHKRLVRRTVYRTECLLAEIQRGNWELSQLPISANGVLVGA